MAVKPNLPKYIRDKIDEFDLEFRVQLPSKIELSEQT